MASTVLKVYRHAGDAVMIDQVTPILRLANTDQLCIRVEIDEADVPLVQPGLSGTFKIRGVSDTAGRLTSQNDRAGLRTETIVQPRCQRSP